MNLKKIRPLFVLFVVLIVIFKAQSLFAQEFNVLQVKGKKAIIEIKSNDKLKAGETYFVNQNIADDGFTPRIKNSRNYLISLEAAEFSSTKSDLPGANTVSNFTLVSKFGWNKKDFEYGPAIGLSNTDTGTQTTTVTGFGGFFTYNFQPNTTGRDLILSADADLIVSNRKDSFTGGASSRLSTTAFYVGPYAKMFILSSDYCFKGGVRYVYEKNSGSNNVKTSGFALTIGLSNYF